ncbi:MAG: response regulator transcription factor [Desulfobulbaceae bacterium]|nr:response regulator transcription factor [Desulfobulbaceae bacterium]
MSEIRLVMIEDHPLVLEAVKQLFTNRKDMTVIGCVSRGDEGLALTREQRPEVVILDISLPDVSGLDLCPLLLEVSPGTKVIFLSMHDQESYIRRALNSGARGYVLKTEKPDRLLNAIDAVMKGKYYLSPEVNETVIKGFLNDGGFAGVDQPNPSSMLPAGLSTRELQVLQMILGGAGNKQIAELLCLSPKTVEKHRANIVEKTKAKTPMSLLRFAIKHNLTSIDNFN